MYYFINQIFIFVYNLYKVIHVYVLYIISKYIKVGIQISTCIYNIYKYIIFLLENDLFILYCVHNYIRVYKMKNYI